MTLTRRRVFFATGAAAAAAALPSAPSFAAAPEAPLLPPASKPEVFRERQEKLKAGAKARGLDALFVAPSTNLAYASRLSIGRSERLTALVFLMDGPAVLVTPAFEEANHRRDAVVDDVQTWPEDGDPIALVAKLLAGRRTIGIECATAYATVSALAAATTAKLEDATAAFDALRMVKSEEEQTCIRDAGARTNAAISATHERLRSGQTDGEAASTIQEALRIAVPALGDDHPQIATYKITLARVGLARKEPEAAEPLLRQALQIRQHAYPRDDWRVGVPKSLLGETLTALGRYGEAEHMLLEAHSVLKDIPGQQGREATATLARLVALYEASGRPEKAKAYRRE